MCCDPRLLTHLIFQDPPTSQQPSAPCNVQFSISHGRMQARPGSSDHLIEPLTDASRNRPLTNCLASNVVPNTEPTSVSFLEGASHLAINNSTMNNIGGNATFNNYGPVMYLSFAVLHYSHEFILRANLLKSYLVSRRHTMTMHARSRAVPALGVPGKIS
jgi:hypothetical protein